MTVKIFGQLTDITGNNTITLEDIADTDLLQEQLHLKFPGLLQCRYVVAVNKNIIQHKTLLPAGAEVALLPPFSGG